MASFSKALSNNVLDSLLPPMGSPREHAPIWDDGQKMFILDNYESAAGHMYYEGMRFSDRIVIKEKVGLYHTWTYLDSLEIYAFNGTKLELVQKRDYQSQFRKEEFVRREAGEMIANYIMGSMKAMGQNPDKELIAGQAKTIVDNSFRSFLSDDFQMKLTRILPQLKLQA